MGKLHMKGIMVWLYFWQSFKNCTMKDSKVCIITRSSSTSLQYKGLATKYTTVKRSLILKINIAENAPDSSVTGAKQSTMTLFWVTCLWIGCNYAMVIFFPVSQRKHTMHAVKNLINSRKMAPVLKRLKR